MIDDSVSMEDGFYIGDFSDYYDDPNENDNDYYSDDDDDYGLFEDDDQDAVVCRHPQVIFFQFHK